MKPRIKDIAKIAGVSIGTVDRVLHSRGGVSDVTREKIEMIADQLNYKPSKAAQALVSSGKKYKIAILYPDAERPFWNEVRRASQYFSEQIVGVYGIEVMPVTMKTYDYVEQLAWLDRLEAEGINGIVTIANHPSKLDNKINELKKKNIPVATIVSDAPNSDRIFFSGLDNIKAGQVAARLMDLHLSGKGKVAVIGVHHESKCIEDRIIGFQQRIRDCPGIELTATVRQKEKQVNSDVEYQTIITKLVEGLLDDHPDLDGIYITNSLTYCVASVVCKRGLVDKIKIIGHERTNINMTYLNDGIIHGIVYQDQYFETLQAARCIERYLLYGKKPDKAMQLVQVNIMIKENVETSYII